MWPLVKCSIYNMYLMHDIHPFCFLVGVIGAALGSITLERCTTKQISKFHKIIVPQRRSGYGPFSQILAPR